MRGTLDAAILPLVAAVMLWTAGFDVIYALQDDEFDREHGLQSLPARYGRQRALMISRACHVLAVVALLWAGAANGMGAIYMGGMGAVAGLLVYEQSVVKPDDLSKVNVAFFTLNGFVSIGVFVVTLLDRLIVTR